MEPKEKGITLEIPNKFCDNSNREITITPPKICPICGLEANNGVFKLYSRKRFISIPLCKEDYEKITRASGNKNSLYVCIGYCSLLIVPLFIVVIQSLIFPNSLILTSILCVIYMLIVGGYSTYYMIKRMLDWSNFVQHIFFRYNKKGSKIDIKNQDWAQEFEKLNESKIII